MSLTARIFIVRIYETMIYSKFQNYKFLKAYVIFLYHLIINNLQDILSVPKIMRSIPLDIYFLHVDFFPFICTSNLFISYRYKSNDQLSI